MKAISLWQPWASAIAAGVKKIETRGHITKYRGRIAIHAAKKDAPELRATWDVCVGGGTDKTGYLADYRAAFRKLWIKAYEDLPRGAIVATAEIVDCIPTETALARNWVIPYEQTWGDYRPGRFAWILRNVEPLSLPVPCKGMQGFFEWQPPA